MDALVSVNGETLRAWRAALRLTQTDAGALLGLSLRQYQRLEGSSAPVSATLALLFGYVKKETK